jgi:hypothetical protein
VKVFKDDGVPRVSGILGGQFGDGPIELIYLFVATGKEPGTPTFALAKKRLSDAALGAPAPVQAKEVKAEKAGDANGWEVRTKVDPDTLEVRFDASWKDAGGARTAQDGTPLAVKMPLNTQGPRDLAVVAKNVPRLILSLHEASPGKAPKPEPAGIDWKSPTPAALGHLLEHIWARLEGGLGAAWAHAYAQAGWPSDQQQTTEEVWCRAISEALTGVPYATPDVVHWSSEGAVMHALQRDEDPCVPISTECQQSCDISAISRGARFPMKKKLNPTRPDAVHQLITAGPSQAAYRDMTPKGKWIERDDCRKPDAMKANVVPGTIYSWHTHDGHVVVLTSGVKKKGWITKRDAKEVVIELPDGTDGKKSKLETIAMADIAMRPRMVLVEVEVEVDDLKNPGKKKKIKKKVLQQDGEEKDITQTQGAGAHVVFVVRVIDDGGTRRVQYLDTGGADPGHEIPPYPPVVNSVKNMENDHTPPATPIALDPSRVYERPASSLMNGIEKWHCGGIGLLGETDLAAGTAHFRKARPTGFARLVVVKRGETAFAPPATPKDPPPPWLVYASPLLRMWTANEDHNFPLSRLLWALRDHPGAADLEVRWLIECPRKKLYEEVIAPGARAKTLTELPSWKDSDFFIPFMEVCSQPDGKAIVTDAYRGAFKNGKTRSHNVIRPKGFKWPLDKATFAPGLESTNIPAYFKGENP